MSECLFKRVRFNASQQHQNQMPPFFSSFRAGLISIGLGCMVFLTPLVCRGADGERSIRIATFNASLYGQSSGDVSVRLADRSDPQARKIASIVQTVRPDILLINEIDFDDKGQTASLLAEHFFSVGQDGQQPLDYPYVFAVSSNTGIDSTMDLNRNGMLGEPEDAFGYGRYPGQYAMAVYSRFPIIQHDVRTFQRFLWKDLPNASRPVHPETGEPYFAESVWKQLRLSSKNHVDVPIDIDGRTVHLLASHPTPPVFDGIEDHNGCRNHDEIRFWIDYLKGNDATYLVDDRGRTGGLSLGELFVIAGDLNSDPTAGDSRQDAIRQLLAHQRLQDPRPHRSGSVFGRPSPSDDSSAEHTASFGSNRTMRIDYVLPGQGMTVNNAGVYWPAETDPRLEASDHRLVWVEVRLDP
jgi:hypothetical protein